MLKKLIACGRPGACRAALDAAVKLGIPCSAKRSDAALPTNRGSGQTQAGRPRETAHNTKLLEQFVQEADGSLIFTRGPLTEDCDFVRASALKYRRQLLSIDLSRTTPLDAASLITSWIRLYRIDKLHVIGPGESEDALIYSDVLTILEAAYYQSAIEFDLRDSFPDRNSDRSWIADKFPYTIDDAVHLLESELSFGDKCRIANIKQENLGDLDFTIGKRIRHEFRLGIDNASLLESCRDVSGNGYMTPSEASAFLLKTLWRKLRDGNVLRVVK